MRARALLGGRRNCRGARGGAWLRRRRGGAQRVGRESSLAREGRHAAVDQDRAVLIDHAKQHIAVAARVAAEVVASPDLGGEGVAVVARTPEPPRERAPLGPPPPPPPP